MAVEAEDRFAFPSLAGIELMRRHLAEDHGIALELWRDVSLMGNSQAEAMLTFRPESPASAEGFWCRECPGAVFMVTEQPKLSSERIAYLSRGDEELQSLLLLKCPRLTMRSWSKPMKPRSEPPSC